MEHWAESTRRKLGSPGAIAHIDDDQKRQASLTLADRARNAAELLEWLDMFGLPPCERALRTSKGERNRGGDYAKRGGE